MNHALDPLNSLWIWAWAGGLSLFSLESGGQVAYTETHHFAGRRC